MSAKESNEMPAFTLVQFERKGGKKRKTEQVNIVPTKSSAVMDKKREKYVAKVAVQAKEEDDSLLSDLFRTQAKPEKSWPFCPIQLEHALTYDEGLEKFKKLKLEGSEENPLETEEQKEIKREPLELIELENIGFNDDISQSNNLEISANTGNYATDLVESNKNNTEEKSQSPNVPIDSLTKELSIVTNLDVSEMECEHVMSSSDVKRAMVFQLMQIYSKIESVRQYLDQTANILTGNRVRESFITKMKRLYRIKLPLKTMDDFLNFEEQLKNNKPFKMDVCKEIKKLVDYGFSINRTIKIVLKIFVSRNLASQFKALRKSVNRSQRHFKFSLFCKCVDAIIILQRSGRPSADSDPDLIAAKRRIVQKRSN